jgi:hypothetical protein
MKKQIVLFSLLLIPALLAGQQKLTIDDLLGPGAGNPQGRGEPVITPDGKFSVVVEKEQIALRSTDGGADKVLTASPDPKFELQLSPDGQRVAYISQGQVWVVPVAGGDELELTHDPKGPGDPRGATDHHPQWNPAGNWILYESGR